jgi:ribosomal protein L11 methyltransferase
MMVSALTTLPGRAAAEALAGAVEALGPFAVGHFEIEDGSGLFEVGAHFEEAPDEVALALLAAAHGARPWAVSEVPDVDWVAKVRRDLPPVEAGRFWLHGAHDPVVPEGRAGLLIEAAMAFGTGHHATTKGCLLAIDRLASEGFGPARRGRRGSGDRGARHGRGSRLARGHGGGGRQRPGRGRDGRGQPARQRPRPRARRGGRGLRPPALAGPFDLILANILKGPLIDLAPDMAAHLSPGGRVVLSGLLEAQADDVAAAYARVGLREVGRDVLGDWAVLVLERDGPGAEG